MSLSTYDPGEVNLYLALAHQVTGYSPDSLIRITKDKDFFSSSTGAFGQVERLHIPDKSYTLEVSLSQTSPSNSVLNALATLDSYTRVGAFPVFAKDSSGNSVFLSSTCWVESSAEASYGRNINDRIWKIRCSEMVFGIGGNGDSDVLSQIGQLTSLIGQAGGNLGVF